MKLSKHCVESLAPKEGRYFIWDDGISGFGIRVEASGRKTFVCRYRKCGLWRQFTLDRYGNITADEARKEARKILGSVALGEDPGAKRETERQAVPFSKVFELFLQEHGAKLKPSSKAEYERAITKHALPKIGRLPAESIARRELNKIHLSLAATPYWANRVIGYLGCVFSWAALNGYVPVERNPARGITSGQQSGLRMCACMTCTIPMPVLAHQPGLACQLSANCWAMRQRQPLSATHISLMIPPDGRPVSLGML